MSKIRPDGENRSLSLSVSIVKGRASNWPAPCSEFIVRTFEKITWKDRNEVFWTMKFSLTHLLSSLHHSVLLDWKYSTGSVATDFAVNFPSAIKSTREFTHKPETNPLLPQWGNSPRVPLRFCDHPNCTRTTKDTLAFRCSLSTAVLYEEREKKLFSRASVRHVR